LSAVARAFWDIELVAVVGSRLGMAGEISLDGGGAAGHSIVINFGYGALENRARFAMTSTRLEQRKIWVKRLSRIRVTLTVITALASLH
jgi:hypothetical protein